MRGLDPEYDTKVISYMLVMTFIVAIIPVFYLRALVSIAALFIIIRLERIHVKLGSLLDITKASLLAFVMTLPFLLISDVRLSGGIPLGDLFDITLFQISVSTWEEVVYRGPLHELTLVSLSSSSLLFSLIHAFNPGYNAMAFLGIFIAGLALGIIRYFWGLLSTISFHLTWNIAIGHIWGFTLSGIKEESIFISIPHAPSLLSGGYFGPEASIISFLEFLLIFLFAFHVDSKTG